MISACESSKNQKKVFSFKILAHLPRKNFHHHLLSKILFKRLRKTVMILVFFPNTVFFTVMISRKRQVEEMK